MLMASDEKPQGGDRAETDRSLTDERRKTDEELTKRRLRGEAEADAVVACLHDSREGFPTLFLLDELLRGTNTIERLAAGEAVLRALLAPQGEVSSHAVMVATHDGEMVSMLDDLYSPFHFRETVGRDGLDFDYRRHPGPASTRTAIALLEVTGAPPEVVAAARARAEELEQEQETRGALH